MAERRARRDKEIQDSDVKQTALDMAFSSLYKQNVPHQLHKALEEQKADCALVVQSKNDLIHNLQEHLEEREESYVSLLKNNSESVNDLISTMHEKTNEYLDQYTSELADVEKNYEQERREYLDKCAEEIRELIKTRRTKETVYRKRREAKIVEAQQKLEEKYEEGYEGYNEIKKAQKGEIHELVEELEKGKADFMLNGERLNYNLQVLRERVKESKNATNLYKRRIGRLQDILSNLIARYQESEKRHQRVNKDLTSQLRRADTQYQDLQKKFQLFEKADKDKYRQLWQMNNQKCKEKVHRVLQADRVLFEEILNMPWQPPELNFWPDQQEELEGGLDDGEEEPIEEVELSEPALMLLLILRNQAPFLVDENVRKAIQSVEGTTEEQADIEGLLTTLKIQKTEDVEDLLEYFTVEGEDGAKMLINPQEGLRALNVYLSERSVKKGDTVKSKTSTMMSSTKGGEGEMTKKRKEAEKSYWKKLAKPVPKEHFAMWESLEEGLEQYLAQLQQRKELINGAEALRAQNEELRALLGQYLHSDINYQLYAPPTLVMSTRNPNKTY
ncbi:Sperm tail/Sperm tail C-terminal domain containing protein, putative [Angomonas deanei]|uniref:Sperm tail/Sperm tail C-terminal domain containing protein, putative n=1 Tax=Angomonas deanei TaxID=59799 RepID=A0A7G2C3J3_9TRYP|nr:Sperm tail/Sperm tail C-terminal domain containing protein, putative [Angomonas deanei]